jgi:hypothetical protein
LANSGARSVRRATGSVTRPTAARGDRVPQRRLGVMTAVETQQARPLSTGERRTIALLGLPTSALALAVTVATTYLPVVARAIVGSTAVPFLFTAHAAIIAAVPLIAGGGAIMALPYAVLIPLMPDG